jgi:hypothetical protein
MHFKTCESLELHNTIIQIAQIFDETSLGA